METQTTDARRGRRTEIMSCGVWHIVQPSCIAGIARIVSARAPMVVVGAEVMIVACVSIAKARRAVDKKWRIEAPAKRTVEDSVARDERECAEPGIPPPTSNPRWPAPRAPAIVREVACLVDVGFAEISGAQTAPAVQVIVLGGVTVEFLRLESQVCLHRQFVAAFHRSGLSALGDFGFPVEDAELLLVQVKVVQACFEQPGGQTTLLHANIVLGIDLVDFDHGLTVADLDLGIDQAGGDHAHGTFAAEPQKHSWSKQDFRFAVFSVQRLASVYLSRPNGVLVQCLTVERDLSFNVVDRSRSSAPRVGGTWVVGLGPRRC